MNENPPKITSPPARKQHWQVLAFSLETLYPRVISEFLATVASSEDEGRKRVVDGFIKRHCLENIYVNGTDNARIIQNNAICIFRYPVSGEISQLERSFWLCMTSHFQNCFTDTLNAQLEDLLRRLKKRLTEYQKQKELEVAEKRKEKK